MACSSSASLSARKGDLWRKVADAQDAHSTRQTMKTNLRIDVDAPLNHLQSIRSLPSPLTEVNWSVTTKLPRKLQKYLHFVQRHSWVRRNCSLHAALLTSPRRALTSFQAQGKARPALANSSLSPNDRFGAVSAAQQSQSGPREIAKIIRSRISADEPPQSKGPINQRSS